ncbi:MAG: hypothetical protein QXU30_07445 [Sulfolobales archaeon]
MSSATKRRFPYLVLISGNRPPATRRDNVVCRDPKSREPIVLEYGKTVKVWLDRATAIWFSKEYLDMIEKEPERAVEIAVKYFEPEPYYLEKFIKTDLSTCEASVVRPLRALQAYLMLTLT